MGRNFNFLEVKDKKSIQLFLNFPEQIYEKDDKWIRYLDTEVEKVFNPEKNKSFRNGEAKRWVLKENGITLGRIAAFYDKKTSEKEEQPTGGIGFFECINDQQAANALFEKSIDWLKSKGMEAVDGPINFGSRETFWGCLKQGFHEAVYNMPYNPPYYNDLFENFGFKNFFNQLTYHMPLEAGLIDQKFRDNAARLKKENDISFAIHDKNNPLRTANNFMKVFNAAWAKFPGVKPMKLSQAKALFKSMKQIIDPKLIIFAYHKNEPIAFFIMIPDLNPLIKDFHGKFHLLNKLRLLYRLKITKSARRALGLIFGVIPEFQGKNITDGMINFFEEEVAHGVNYTDLEMNWIGDFNPRMINMIKSLNADVKKIHVTYRYLFDRNKDFKRAKII